MICRFILLLGLALVFFHNGYAGNSYELNAGWKCRKADKTSGDGARISLPSFDMNDWMPAVVPGTVLTTLIANKQVPDPFYGANNRLIPDIHSTGRGYYTYWFAKDFKENIPVAGSKVWLHFRGVNYSYDAYLNGHKLNNVPHTGMYLRATYDITPWLAKDGDNRLAVIVYPPDPAGNPNGGQGGDGVIARNVSNQYVAGWDWIPAIADRNTGIWDKVSIEKTGAVTVRNVHVVTRVPGIRMFSDRQDPAQLEVSAELENTSAQKMSGVLQYRLQGKTVLANITLAANEKKLVQLPGFTITNPKLWWPNGYGTQPLYRINVQFAAGKKILDEEAVSFGVRELQAVWNTHTQSRELHVNGRRVFIKGGNWITSDALLRFSRERYDAELHFHHDMNLNLVRVWGGGLTERPEFYEACDKYGLLVFQDFWVSGDCNGRWYDTFKKEDTLVRRMYPDDHQLFINAVADQVKMIRNHPSLAYWCGGNEIKPPPDILAAIRDSILPTLDGTRFFFPFSNDDSMSLHSHDGPYTIQPERYFWEHRSWPFNSEIGSVGIGDMASLERFMPEENRVAPFYDAQKKAWVADSMWTYHKYTGYDSSVLAYGAVKSMNDFLWKAQMVNYNQYRALAEGFSAHMWDWCTGVIIWKTQNPWTAMRGQMYDYYLDPNACLYGLKKGGDLLHAMFNPADSTVMLVNNSNFDWKFLVVEVLASGAVPDTVIRDMGIDHSSCKTVGSIREILRKNTNGFLVLRLGTAKETLHENIYWLPDAQGNYTAVQQLPEVKTNISAKLLPRGSMEVMIRNPSASVSFFNRISIEDKRTHKRILPVFYSDNYVTVMPGKGKAVFIEGKQFDPATQEVVVEGWNGALQRVAVSRE